MCLFNVDGGQRAVIFDRFQGVKEAVVGEGTHFMIPVVQKPIIIDVRARPRTINSITGTKDLQMANISLRVLSRPLESELPRIYQELGTDFDDRVLPSLGNEVSAKPSISPGGPKKDNPRVSPRFRMFAVQISRVSLYITATG